MWKKNILAKEELEYPKAKDFQIEKEIVRETCEEEKHWKE